MLDDPAALQEVCRTFAASLANLEAFVASHDRAEIEADLSGRLTALAGALGARRPVRVRLLPLDFPKRKPFPKHNHQHAGSIGLRGRAELELWLNSNALHLGNFALIVGRLHVLLWLAAAALERVPDLVADVPIFPGDVCFWDAVTFSGTDPHGCFVPDPDYFRTGGYADFRAAMERSMPPWEDRRRVVIWRGSTSGIKRYWPPAHRGDARWIPRLELCERSQSPAIAEYCDIGFMNLVQVAEADRPALEADLARLRRPPVDKSTFARCRATIDIDGNSNTWSSGLFCSFLTGACVIKVASVHGFRQWYYDRLEPWVHYVPVEADFSDFEDRVRLVMTDDDLARRIGQAGRELARSMDFRQELSAAAERLVAFARRHASASIASNSVTGFQ
jgi:hypothetical protein